MSDGKPSTGPNGLPLLRLPRLPRAPTTPATPTAPAAPPRPDPFDIMRASKRRLATREEIMKLARKWSRS
ncbi:hypothetical protein LG047_00185 [Methylocystis sp. WRRC1]|uniref:hypothetical protein n=1 Tax=Methylocystis sp. WRRC1 TaxID=1732014 RepID=UPI001D15A8DA|nr:hypothetical protein [Methylocystis sp. WRRC1]MCC3243754.1 hypothetical protein [Methylocystis sp. WRRC1]